LRAVGAAHDHAGNQIAAATLAAEEGTPAAPGDAGKDRREMGERPAYVRDIALRSVTRQTRGMGCELYDIGIRDGATGKMMMRTWDRDGVLGSVPFLKGMNAGGNDIYIRPSVNISYHDLILVDDVSRGNAASMAEFKIEPAVIVETSPDNLQVWVKVGEAVPREIRKTIAVRLVCSFDGDRASADGIHFGRLAGFTNRKAKYRQEGGLFPWVKCSECGGRTATMGPALIEDARREVDEREMEEAERKQNAAGPGEAVPAGADMTGRDVIAEFLSEFRMASARIGDDDYSRCDWRACLALARRGWGKEDIMMALTEVSPDLAERKEGHVDDYAARTAEKAVRQVRRG
jgi:hypothetical protein